MVSSSLLSGSVDFFCLVDPRLYSVRSRTPAIESWASLTVDFDSVLEDFLFFGGSSINTDISDSLFYSLVVRTLANTKETPLYLVIFFLLFWSDNLHF